MARGQEMAERKVSRRSLQTGEFMTDQSAPKRPDSCPRCLSVDPKVRLCFPFVLPCNHPWHDTTATTTPQYPIPLNEHQLASIEIWAKDSGPSIGDVWGNEEVRRLNLTTFARKILGDAEPAPLTAEENQDNDPHANMQHMQKDSHNVNKSSVSSLASLPIHQSPVAPPLTEAPQPVPTDS